MELDKLMNLAGLMGIDVDDDDRDTLIEISKINESGEDDNSKIRSLVCVLLGLDANEVPKFDSFKELKNYIVSLTPSKQKAQVRAIFGFAEDLLVSKNTTKVEEVSAHISDEQADCAEISEYGAQEW